MNLKTILKRRINLSDIADIISQTNEDEMLKQNLFQLLLDKDERISYQAAWVLFHFSKEGHNWLQNKQNELIDEAMHCSHHGKRRVLLQILVQQSFSSPPRVDFLDFCFEKMTSKKETIAIQASSMYIAYKLCRKTPELLAELNSLLEILEPGLLTPATRSTRKKVLRAIKKENE